MMLLGLQSIFVLCVCYVIVSDFRNLRISELGDHIPGFCVRRLCRSIP